VTVENSYRVGRRQPPVVDLQNNQLLDASLDAKHTDMDRLKAAVEKAAIESRMANDSNQL